MNKKTDTFAAHYATLKQIADELRAQQEPDIDKLIPMVDSANAAYKACKARLDAVEAALNERMQEETHGKDESLPF